MSMTNHQKDQILKVVEYYMTPELRDKIMREVPVAYNAWVGYPVVDIIYEGYIPKAQQSYQTKEPPKNP